MNQPPVTIVVCAYNAAKDIQETLESLLVQTYRNFEILVVDDASTDETPAICAGFMARDPRVRVVRHPENVGLSHGRNTGVKEASHELLTFIDADDIALPNMVETLVRELLADSNRMGVSAYRIYFDDDRDLGLQKIGPTSLEAYMVLYTGNKLMFLTYPNLVRRKDVLQVGGYRVDIFDDGTGVRYADLCEDLDIWCRMSDLSAEGRYFITLEEPLSKYRKPADSMSTKNVKHMQNKMRWIKHCLLRRRMGESELSYGDFLANQTWRDRLGNGRKDLAAGVYKKAGLFYGQRRFLRMAFCVVAAAFLSPKLISQKIKTQAVRG